MKKVLTICTVAGLFVVDAGAMNVPFSELPEDIRNNMRDWSHFRVEKEKFGAQKAEAEARKARVDADAYADETEIRGLSRKIVNEELKQRLDELEALEKEREEKKKNGEEYISEGKIKWLQDQVRKLELDLKLDVLRDVRKEKEKEEKKGEAEKKRWGYRLKKWGDRRKNSAEGWFYRGKGVASVAWSAVMRFPGYGSAFFPGFASVPVRGFFQTLPSKWGWLNKAVSCLPGSFSNGYLVSNFSNLGSFLSSNPFLVSGGLVTAASVWINGYEKISNRAHDFANDLSNGFVKGNAHLKKAGSAFGELIGLGENTKIEREIDYVSEIEILKAEKSNLKIEKANLLREKSVLDRNMKDLNEEYKELGKRSRELEKKGRVDDNFWDYLWRVSCTKKIRLLEADLKKLEEKKKKLEGKKLSLGNSMQIEELDEKIKSLTTKGESISKRINSLKKQEKIVREERESLRNDHLTLDAKRETLKKAGEELLDELAIKDEKMSLVSDELRDVRRDMLMSPVRRIGSVVSGAFQRGLKFADIFWNVGSGAVSYVKSSLKFVVADVPSLVVSSAPGFTSLLLYDAIRSYGHYVWGPVSYPAVSYVLAGSISSLCGYHVNGSYAWDQFWQHVNNGIGYFKKSAEHFELASE